VARGMVEAVKRGTRTHNRKEKEKDDEGEVQIFESDVIHQLARESRQ